MRVRWKSEWTPILGLVFLLRIIYSALGWFVASGPAPEPLASGPVYDFSASLLASAPLAEKLINVWWRWDTPYYLSIAAQGYAIDKTQAYLPLYPLLIHWARPLAAGDYLSSALLISSLAALATGILLYEVARAEGWSESEALQTTITLFMFPTAFFLFAGYTEALFLSLTLAAWLLARHRKWGAAGLAGGLASLTRFSGVLLTPVFLWIYLVDCSGMQSAKFGDQIRELWKQGLKCFMRPGWLATLVPAASVGAYLLWTRQVGQAAPSDVLAAGWGIRTVPPWEGFRLFIERLLFTPRVFIDWIDLSLFCLALIACIYGLFRLGSRLSLYNWSYLALLMTRGTPPHLLDSFSRYLLLLFPIFLLAGQAGHRLPRVFLWAISFALQIILAWGFLQWKWIA